MFEMINIIDLLYGLGSVGRNLGQFKAVMASTNKHDCIVLKTSIVWIAVYIKHFQKNNSTKL